MTSTEQRADSTGFTIEGVGADTVARAREIFMHMGMDGVDADAGTAVGRGGRVDYRYDPGVSTVTCEIVEVPEPFSHLSKDAATRAVRELLHGALGPEIGAEGGEGRLGKAGVYCYVLPTVTNLTGLDLAYSTSDFSHGLLANYEASLPNAKTESLFEAQSANSSGLGVSGSVTYQLSDGTKLTFTFYLLSTCDYSFAAGFGEQNAGRYQPPEVSNKDATLSGYTYLEPIVVLKKK
jgi:hypothetical protein